MSDSYQSVGDLVRGVVDDRGFAEALRKDIVDLRLAKVLFTMRAVAGKTQAELAGAVGRSQASISKLENSTIDRIRVSDLVAYARALDLQLSIRFEHKMRSVEAIKYHAVQIRRILDHLVKVAGEDQDIVKGVKNLHVETLINMVQLVVESAAKLPETAGEERPVLEVCPPPPTREQESPDSRRDAPADPVPR
jgi:transcriptional regulator with XRE-family HTH domain